MQYLVKTYFGAVCMLALPPALPRCAATAAPCQAIVSMNGLSVVSLVADPCSAPPLSPFRLLSLLLSCLSVPSKRLPTAEEAVEARIEALGGISACHPLSFSHVVNLRENLFPGPC